MKETIGTIRQSAEKIFASDMINNKLISKIYKQLIQLNIKKKKPTKNQIKKWTKSLNRPFSKEDTDGQQAHEKMFNIINHQRNATIGSYYCICVKIVITKKSTNNKCQRGCREKGTLVHCWRECKLVQPLWKTIL